MRNQAPTPLFELCGGQVALAIGMGLHTCGQARACIACLYGVRMLVLDTC